MVHRRFCDNEPDKLTRVRSKKGIRLSVTLDEKEYAELTKLGSDLDCRPLG
jgi:hypothetical protein